MSKSLPCSNNSTGSSTCDTSKRFDWLLWGSLGVIAGAFFSHFGLPSDWLANKLVLFAEAVVSLMGLMWWGLVAGMVMIGLLSKVPREFVVSLLGKGGIQGIARAAGAGVLLDLCNHGVLLIGAKLYERGVSIGQVVAFLIASPWNSFSMTIILVALVGIGWTILFVVLSLVVSVITGLVFEYLQNKGTIPSNPNTLDLPRDFHFWRQAIAMLKTVKITPAWLSSVVRHGVKDSRMVMRWVLFGVVLAAMVRTFVDAEDFVTYFGPTWLGLWLTLLVATLMEICSEGSLPIASDMLTRAKAPGNGFLFLMAGVSTDYTEVMVLKSATRSWRIALLLPAITVPQIIVLAWIINQWSV